MSERRSRGERAYASSERSRRSISFRLIPARLSSNPSINKERQLEDPKNIDARMMISKQAEQLYKQADELMRNAVLGEFPKDADYRTTKHGKKRPEGTAATGQNQTRGTNAGTSRMGGNLPVRCPRWCAPNRTFDIW